MKAEGWPPHSLRFTYASRFLVFVSLVHAWWTLPASVFEHEVRRRVDQMHLMHVETIFLLSTHHALGVIEYRAMQPWKFRQKEVEEEEEVEMEPETKGERTWW